MQLHPIVAAGHAVFIVMQTEPAKLPDDARHFVREFLTDPKIKAECASAMQALRVFLERREREGTLVALAEIEDRLVRVCLARAIGAIVAQSRNRDEA